MNLHEIASGLISTVNPSVPVKVRISTGYTTDATGHRIPSYQDHFDVPAQVQPLSYKEIMQLDALNIQGTRKVYYLNGAVAGLVRVKKQGGDVLTLPDGTTWLVVLVSEQWPDWCRVVCTLQNGS